jgi:hypothetical protein
MVGKPVQFRFNEGDEFFQRGLITIRPGSKQSRDLIRRVRLHIALES